MDRQINIFVSYAHKNSSWVDRNDPFQIIPFLEDSLRWQGVKVWYDHDLKTLPGIEYERKIAAEIDRADIAILLLSRDFLNSEFIITKELPRIQEKSRETLEIVPILVEPWSVPPHHPASWLVRMQIIPGDVTPLVDYTDSRKNFLGARENILQSVERTLERIKYAAETADTSPAGPSAQPPEPTHKKQQTLSPGQESQPESTKVNPPKNDSLDPQVSQKEVKQYILDAISKIELQTFGVGGIEDKNSKQIWREIHSKWQGKEIDLFCRLSSDERFRLSTHKGHCETVKLAKLLFYSLTTPEGEKNPHPILEALKYSIKASFSTQGPGLDAVRISTLSDSEKWNYLYDLLDESRGTTNSKIIETLLEYTGDSKREKTLSRILDLLEDIDEDSFYGSAIAAVKKLNGREELYRIRKLVTQSVRGKKQALDKLIQELEKKNSPQNVERPTVKSGSHPVDAGEWRTFYQPKSNYDNHIPGELTLINGEKTTFTQIARHTDMSGDHLDFTEEPSDDDQIRPTKIRINLQYIKSLVFGETIEATKTIYFSAHKENRPVQCVWRQVAVSLIDDTRHDVLLAVSRGAGCGEQVSSINIAVDGRMRAVPVESVDSVRLQTRAVPFADSVDWNALKGEFVYHTGKKIEFKGIKSLALTALEGAPEDPGIEPQKIRIDLRDVTEITIDDQTIRFSRLDKHHVKRECIWRRIDLVMKDGQSRSLYMSAPPTDQQHIRVCGLVKFDLRFRSGYITRALDGNCLRSIQFFDA